MKLSELIIVMLAIGLIAGIALGAMFTTMSSLVQDLFHGRIDLVGILIGFIIGVASTLVSNKYEMIWPTKSRKNK